MLKKFKRKSNPLETKHMEVQCTNIKALDSEAGTFSAYGNTFDIVDHAGDLSIKGCFKNTINNHVKNGTMPKFLGQHQGRMMPLGIITKMEEDDTGLLFEGKFCLDTQAGKEAYALVKMGAIDQFSIGYNTIKESFDNTKGINYLLEVDVKEISLVTFACNENSRLQSVKSAIDAGEEITPRMLQDTLRDVYGLSKRASEAAINAIKATEKAESEEELVVKSIEDFREKMKTAETKNNIKSNELQTKELGGLSFREIHYGVRNGLLEFIGHDDFWLVDLYDEYGFVESWNYVEKTYILARFEWVVGESGDVEVSRYEIGSVDYVPEFTPDMDADEVVIDEDVDDGEKENGNNINVKEDLEDLLSKENFSDWFVK